MENNNLGQKTLNQRYKKVVDEQLKSDKTLEQKDKIYQDHTKLIDDSINKKKAIYQSLINDLEQAYKKDQNTLLKTYKQQVLALDKGLKEEKKRYTNDLKELDETLENKRSLNMLKEEKIDAELKMAKESFMKETKKETLAIEKTFEKAKENHQTKKSQLTLETKEKLEALSKTHQATRKHYDDALEKINASSKVTLDAIDSKLQSTEDAFKDALKKALADYESALKPIHKSIEQLKIDYDKSIEELNTYYETEITKKQKYQKEKEKIADQQAASELAKEIKKLQKVQKEQLAHKKETYQNDLAPLNTTLEETIASHKSNIYDLKEQYVDQITNHLKEKETIKQQTLIALNETNTKLLKEEALYTHKKETITIDETIQSINFDQTLEEATLSYEVDSNLLSPKELLKVEQAKKQYNEQMNELTKLKNYIKEVHKKDLKLLDLKLALKTEQNAYELKRLHQVYQYDKEALKLRHHQEIMENEHMKEAFLVKHYYVHAKNYVALKNETIEAFKSSTHLEINNRLELITNHYQALIKKAERDHEVIISNIESTYQDEIKLYEEAYNQLNESQKNVLSDLTHKHSKDLEKDKAEIDRLNPKTDKVLLKKYQKNYELKVARYEEIVKQKAEEIKAKKALYTTMIEKIKAARIHSLEEAETLLIHIKDQLDLEISNQKDQAEKEIKRFNQMQYEMRKSAELFDTFQRGREEETLKLSENYKQNRIDKEEEALKALKDELNQELAYLKTNFKAYESENNTLQKETTHAYQVALEHLEATKEENYKNIQDLYQTEKRRLDQTIKTITKNYEQALKTSKNRTDQLKSDCFNKKSNADDTLKDTIKEKDKDHEKYIQERNTLKEKDFDRFNDASLHLLKLVKNDALTLLSEKEIPLIKAMILGEKAVEL
jgi:hypothetical protein